MRTAIALAALVATASAYVAGPRFGAPARATAARSVVVKGSFFDNFGEGMKERASAPAQMSPRGVVVTGGAGGVGYAYVEEFVRTGHMVVFCDINEELLTAAPARAAGHRGVGPSASAAKDKVLPYTSAGAMPPSEA